MFEFIFPSIIALAVGFIAYFATITSVKRQIESSQKIAELDFKKSVLSNNRQLWINELRNVISDLISTYDAFAILPEKSLIKDYEKLLNLISKAELMLNPRKDIEFIESLNELKKTIRQLVRKEISYQDVSIKLEDVKQKLN